MYILGINAYHCNASAAIVADGRLIAAVEEERFNRVKYAAGFPSAAIRYCLDAAGITINRPPRDGQMAFVRSPDGISIELLQLGDPLPPKAPWAGMVSTGSW